jgi:heavy metal translocating P-type ATPase
MTGRPVPPETSGALLGATERLVLGLRLALALAAAGLLLLSFGLAWLAPDQGEVAGLIAGVAALLVAPPVLVGAWRSLTRPSLCGLTDQLVSLAVIAAWAVGDLTTAALLPLVMTVGHILEERSLLGSREAIEALGRLTRSRGRRLAPDGAVTEVDASELRPGDRVELRAGDRIPADGIVLTGTSSLDTGSVTGESLPVEVRAGDPVLAGTTNCWGRLEVEITRTGRETVLGKVVALMHEAERAKPPVTRLLERYAGRYLVLVLALAAGAWFASHQVSVMMAVLVASCPCALVLAAPATAVAALAVAARHGILIKGSAFLEELAGVDSLILDKTGTLTHGELCLTEVIPAPGVDAAAMMALAAGLGSASSHPVSRAAAAAVPVADRLPVSDLVEIGGIGLTARDRGARVVFGRAEVLRAQGIDPGEPPDHDGPAACVGRDGVLLGWLLFADRSRAEAHEALEDLRGLGLTRQVLLSGDRRRVAEAVAGAIGISEVEGEVLPEQKLQRVLDQVRAGWRPLVVGDGVNDSLALKAGAVGVAMGVNGTDVALASADLVLMTSDLRRLGTCIRLARRCRRTIAVNVALGLGWTAAVISVAALGWFGAEGALAAAVLHNLGTLAVMANAGRLLRFDERLA